MEQIRPNDTMRRQAIALPKVATRIEGLDEILQGGIPAGGMTLVWGDGGAVRASSAWSFCTGGPWPVTRAS
jgi:archaellum biogenesis ATPase FlaH